MLRGESRRPVLLLAACVVLPGLPGCGDHDAGQESADGPVAGSGPRRLTEESRNRCQGGIAGNFRDVAVKVGVHFRRFDDISRWHRIIESTGGGVGLLDYDRNGRLDIFLPNGCRLPVESAERSHPNELFRNVHETRFVKVTRPSGLLQFGYCHGCAVGDYNHDGFPDLYVTAFGRNRLWRNNGDGSFSDVTVSSGTGCRRWSSSAAFADVNGDGLLDLYVANYLAARDDRPRLCRDEQSPDGYVQCVPGLFEASRDVLYLSDGRGRFLDVTTSAGITGRRGKGLGVAAFDADQNGWIDLYVANDGTPNFLYLNRSPQDDAERSPRFEETGGLWGAAVNFHGLAEAGMGVAAGDYDGDGWTDLFVTNFRMETDTLYRNLNGSGFADRTSSGGLCKPTRRWLGFGTEFLDYDNDGWLDLFVANGHVDDRRWRNEPWRMPPQLFRNRGDGRFVDVSECSGSYFQRSWIGRGAAVGDIDNDGDLDLVVSHQMDRAAVLKNETGDAGRSVQVKLVGTDSNRTAVGARVETEVSGRALVREVVGGGSFQSSSDRRVHIGLGQDETLQALRIRWPSGAVTEARLLRPGRYVAVEAGRIMAVGARGSSIK